MAEFENKIGLPVREKEPAGFQTLEQAFAQFRDSACVDEWLEFYSTFFNYRTQLMLTTWRNQASLSFEELARKVAIPLVTLQSFEAGATSPTLHQVYLIADACGGILELNLKLYKDL